MMFLCESVKKFLRDTSSFSLPIPFGNGPWICRNPVCTGDNQEVIRKCVRVDQYGKYISGFFCCPMCGFTFARRWKLGVQEDDKPYAVLTMGHLYLSTLLELRDRGLNNNQIAKRLKTSPTQIQRALTRYEEPSSDTRILQSLRILAVNGDSNAEVAAASEDEGQVNENREKIKNILFKYTGITRTQIAKKHSHLYHKMLKHDREWMEEVLPPSKKNNIRVDWNKLDKEHSELICEASDAVYISNPPEQIKKYTILSHVSNNVKEQLKNSFDKFPQTIKLLMNSIESDEHYLLRHLPVIINQMYKYSEKEITLERIKSYSPMYRKSSMEFDERLIEELERLL